LARRKLPARTGSYSPESVERELTFLGLMAMMDPPRPEVARAMDTLHQAGIRMVMITGDYGLTAESLARRVGMLTTPNPLIVTGAEMETMTDFELQNLLEKEIIYARMAPDHKLRLVAAYQAGGEVVAVTGDGVNDAPALRKADVAVAMGMVGTDVAKEAADVILTDDNFGDFVSAIEEGRAVYDNLRKFITYIFSSNVPEILPFILAALFNIPLALLVIQILAIDLGTDLLPALALGTEKPEPDVMHRPPRRRTQPLLDRHLFQRAFGWLGLLKPPCVIPAFSWFM
jgi:magnesium-transporting ATPase (P-type)